MQCDFMCPQVMGIINLSPDSFASVGRCQSVDQALRRAHTIIDEGGTILDIGAEATNPKQDVPVLAVQQELDRLIPVIEKIAAETQCYISVDTSKAEVMRAAIQAGAHMINDQRALRNAGAIEAIKELNVPVCLMHMRFPNGQTTPPCYDYPDGVIPTILAFLTERVQACVDAGIARSNLMIDPGIGYGSFGKTTQQNNQILQSLAIFKSLELPILVGVSRKTFIGDVLKVDEAQRLVGSLAATSVALMHGASIIRTHDIKASVETVKMIKSIQESV